MKERNVGRGEAENSGNELTVGGIGPVYSHGSTLCKERSQTNHSRNQERGQHEVQAMAGRLTSRFGGQKFSSQVFFFS